MPGVTVIVRMSAIARVVGAVNSNIATVMAMVVVTNHCGMVMVVMMNHCGTTVIAVGVMTAAVSATVAYVNPGTGAVVAVGSVMAAYGEVPCS